MTPSRQVARPRFDLPPPSLFLGWPLDRDEVQSNSGLTASILNQRTTRDFGNAIKYSGDSHLVTFASTGSGKGVGVIIPNLLHYSGPAIVIDPKGENFAVTARYRRQVLKQRVFLLDPFNTVPDEVVKTIGALRGRLNPLDLCHLSETGIENDSQMIANLVSGSGSLGDDPFWDISARKVISGLVAQEMDASKRESRSPKFRFLNDQLFADDPIDSMTMMIETGKPSKFVRACVSAGFLSLADATRSGVLATAQSYVATMMSQDVLNALDESTISLWDVQNSSDYTLYIVIPPNKLDSHSALLATWVGVLMHGIMERKTPPEKRTLFMLDECANLGKLEVLRKAVTLLRGYGLQVWMFFQDLAQLKSLFEHDFATMVNNCGVLQTFGLGRLSAAEPIAKLVGGLRSRELLQLDARQQVLSVIPGAAKVARLGRYYEDSAFAGRFDENPLIRKPKVTAGRFYINSHRTDFTV
jgi:type IV secretion system protein VirD4